MQYIYDAVYWIATRFDSDRTIENRKKIIEISYKQLNSTKETYIALEEFIRKFNENLEEKEKQKMDLREEKERLLREAQDFETKTEDEEERKKITLGHIETLDQTLDRLHKKILWLSIELDTLDTRRERLEELQKKCEETISFNKYLNSFHAAPEVTETHISEDGEETE